MCGRFTVYGEISDIKIAVSAQVEQLFRPWTPHYNISPSAGPGHEQLIALTGDDGQRVLKLARWWFIPPTWDKPLNKLPTAFNARAEDIDQKRLWKGAIKTSRCLAVAEESTPTKSSKPQRGTDMRSQTRGVSTEARGGAGTGSG